MRHLTDGYAKHKQYTSQFSMLICDGQTPMNSSMSSMLKDRSKTRESQSLTGNGYAEECKLENYEMTGMNAMMEFTSALCLLMKLSRLSDI